MDRHRLIVVHFSSGGMADQARTMAEAKFV